MASGSVLFEVSKSTSMQSINQTQSVNSGLNGLSRTADQQIDDENKGRLVKYEFTPEFLKLKTVGAT